MAVPKYKTSKSKRNLRRSHHALKPTSLAYCAGCGEAKLSHTICKSCGMYDGKVVAAPKSAVGGLTGGDFNVD